eukprot:11959666-Alexandrium_andersonii.AAC.1
MCIRDSLGQTIPFGSKVFFHANERQGASYRKMDPRGIPGVFAGYSLKDRYRWDGYYYVWALKDFAIRDLRYDARYGPHHTLTAHK